MRKKYNLKLLPETIKYLKKIRKKYKVRVSVADIQDFNISYFGITIQGGAFFDFDNQSHIYVNNKQYYKSGHDYIVLHEIAHLLLYRYNFKNYSNQEESYANGYALSLATELNIPIDEKLIKEMCKYSNRFFLKNLKSRRRLDEK